MTLPPLLDELLRAPAPSGREEAVSAIVRRELAALGVEVRGDVLGCTTAVVPGHAGTGRTAALVAHADQIGLVVSGADENGLLRVRSLATWRATSAIGHRFTVLARGGEVPAVALRAPGGDVPGWADVRLDVGARDAAEARALVAPGDPAVFVAEPVELAGGRFASPAIDDRVGVFAALEAFRSLAARPAAWDVALVVTTQEEAGDYLGARAALATLAPEIAVVVESTYASDVPSDYEPWGDTPLGGGPSVLRGAVVHPLVAEGLVAAAAAAGVPLAFEAGRETWSDADGIAAQAGLAVGLLSVPTRSSHTAVEVAQLSDVEAAVAILETYVQALEPGLDLVR
jgi:endoglucanase